MRQPGSTAFAFGLALAFGLTLAPAARAQDHAARVERLLGVLPDAEAKPGDGQPSAEDEAEAARLIAANPGKEAAVRSAVAEHARCEADFVHTGALASLRRTADSLTDAELDKLVEFYTSPDFQRIEEADEAQIEALNQRYPLMRFYQAMQKVMADDMPGMIEGFAACDAAQAASLERAGVSTD